VRYSSSNSLGAIGFLLLLSAGATLVSGAWWLTPFVGGLGLWVMNEASKLEKIVLQANREFAELQQRTGRLAAQVEHAGDILHRDRRPDLRAVRQAYENNETDDEQYLEGLERVAHETAEALAEARSVINRPS
jgi:hypothetical protein